MSAISKRTFGERCERLTRIRCNASPAGANICINIRQCRGLCLGPRCLAFYSSECISLRLRLASTITRRSSSMSGRLLSALRAGLRHMPSERPVAAP